MEKKPLDSVAATTVENEKGTGKKPIQSIPVHDNDLRGRRLPNAEINNNIVI